MFNFQMIPDLSSARNPPSLLMITSSTKLGFHYACIPTPHNPVYACVALASTHTHACWTCAARPGRRLPPGPRAAPTGPPLAGVAPSCCCCWGQRKGRLSERELWEREEDRDGERDGEREISWWIN